MNPTCSGLTNQKIKMKIYRKTIRIRISIYSWSSHRIYHKSRIEACASCLRSHQLTSTSSLKTIPLKQPLKSFKTIFLKSIKLINKYLAKKKSHKDNWPNRFSYFHEDRLVKTKICSTCTNKSRIVMPKGFRAWAVIRKRWLIRYKFVIKAL